MLGRMSTAPLAERIARLNRLAAELAAQLVDCALRHGALARLFVNQVGRVSLAVIGEVADTDPE
jgi:hypothetical protein